MSSRLGGLLPAFARGLIGPAFGPELIPGGNGSSTTGMTTDAGTLAATGTALRVTTSGGFGQVGIGVTGLTIGKTYRLAATMAPSAGDQGRVGDAGSINLNYSVNGSPAFVDFVADATGKTIYLQTVNGAGVWQANGQFVDFTVSLREKL